MNCERNHQAMFGFRCWSCHRIFDGDVEYVELEMVESTFSYEWSYRALLERQTDKELFFYSGNGCSCNSPYDELNFTPVKSVQDVERGYGISENEWHSFLNRVAKQFASRNK